MNNKKRIEVIDYLGLQGFTLEEALYAITQKLIEIETRQFEIMKEID